MTQEPAWLAFQPIGDRPWWGADAQPPFLEVTNAVDAGVLDAPDALPSERALPTLPAETGAA